MGIGLVSNTDSRMRECHVLLVPHSRFGYLAMAEAEVPQKTVIRKGAYIYDPSPPNFDSQFDRCGGETDGRFATARSTAVTVLLQRFPLETILNPSPPPSATRDSEAAVRSTCLLWLGFDIRYHRDLSYSDRRGNHIIQN